MITFDIINYQICFAMKEIIKPDLVSLNESLNDLNLTDCIRKVCDIFEGKKVFSTSFGIEDQVITHVLADLYQQASPIELFTLDTGRQFDETYEVFHQTQIKYPQLPITVYYPQENDIRAYIASEGVNGFYKGVEQRKACCQIRKVKPLTRALLGVDLWVTGLRAEQSDNREGLQLLMWDDHYQLVKFNPLLKFTLAQLDDLIKQYHIPINSLYRKGYLSIGCAPCTRALRPGESFRAGRWWWEDSKKECGLHPTNATSPA
jgi:phosphoadenosine phosphosulfate reductase